MELLVARELVVGEARSESYHCPTHARFPGPAALPVVLHRAALRLPHRGDPASLIEQLFAGHDWRDSWRDTVYPYHHYHSTAHEVLGCYRGHALVQVGGEQGPKLELSPGDVLVLPAGAAHCRVRADGDFHVVGAYAGGRAYDMCKGRHEERAQAEENIRNVPRPKADPVFGPEGPLMKLWAR